MLTQTGTDSSGRVPKRAAKPRRRRPKAPQRWLHRHRSPQSVALELASRLIVKNTVRAWAAQPGLRWPFAAVDRLAGVVPRRWPLRSDRVLLDNCDAELIRPRKRRAGGGDASDSPRGIVYLHGGAFVTCGLNTHRSLAMRLAKAADAQVLNINYRMLPRHRISDAVDDALSGLIWLQRQGIDPKRTVIAGDSAGGYLAFMSALAAHRRLSLTPAGIATVSPLTDADPSCKLAHRNADRCAMFPSAALAMFATYLRRSEVQDDAEGAYGEVAGEVASPVDADLSGLPPVAIHASRDEMLLCDAETMADRIGSAGIRCDLHLWSGQIHDFPVAADVLPEGRRALRYIGDFVKEVTAGKRPRNPAA